jgi:hypothetical protein
MELLTTRPCVPIAQSSSSRTIRVMGFADVIALEDGRVIRVGGPSCNGRVVA